MLNKRSFLNSIALGTGALVLCPKTLNADFYDSVDFLTEEDLCSSPIELGTIFKKVIYYPRPSFWTNEWSLTKNRVKDSLAFDRPELTWYIQICVHIKQNYWGTPWETPEKNNYYNNNYNLGLSSKVIRQKVISVEDLKRTIS